MMQQSSLVMFSSTLVAALTLLTQATTFAADQPTGAAPVATAAKKAVIETMIVTAEKRETSLQKTPIAITAISGDAINDKGLRTFNDVSFAAPALVYSQIAGMAQITIRGIGVDVSTLDAEPGVALYQDGANFQNNGAFDLAAVPGAVIDIGGGSTEIILSAAVGIGVRGAPPDSRRAGLGGGAIDGPVRRPGAVLGEAIRGDG